MIRAGLFATIAVSALLSVVLTGAQEGRSPSAGPRAGAGEYNQPGGEPPPDPAVVRLRNAVNPELPPWSPAYVVDRCAEHISTINEKDRYRIRYLDMADVPRAVLPAGTATAYFGANSLASVSRTILAQPVPGTDNRIYWLDLAWYNWTVETWENIAREDPYFLEPIVPGGKGTPLEFLKLATRANAVVRAGWFFWYAFDNGEFLNVGETFNEKAFYYQLVYSNVEIVRNGKKVRGVGPATMLEFEQAWAINLERLRRFPFDVGFMVDQGMSGVAWQNRIAWRVDDGSIVFWKTFDVKRTAGDQDFFETPFPKTFDASEGIVKDGRGAYFYHLWNGKGASVDFADPFVVKGDPVGPHNNVLVTGKSCIHCHDTGILNFRNEHLINTEAGVKLLALTPDRAERFTQFFLQEKRTAKYVKRDQEDYADFVQECNGLTPAENMVQFNKFRAWYIKGVTMDQAARDVGCDREELEDALGYLATKGRLGRLALDGYPVPRHAWERGLYQEAALLLLEWRKLPKMQREELSRTGRERSPTHVQEPTPRSGYAGGPGG